MTLLRSILSLVGWRAFGFAIGVVVLELALYHVGGFGRRAVTELTERYGWRYLPSQSAYYTHDLSIPETINSTRFRDREWAAPEDVDEDSVFRVAVFGNSMTMGSGVHVEQTWTRRLEELLDEELAQRGDTREALVMNFGVPAYTTEQMLRVYEDVVRPWHPDLVVLSIHPMDLTPMKPAVDEADYPLRTAVVRTATYDLLLRHVIGKWISKPVMPKGELMLAWEAEFNAMMADPYTLQTRPQWAAAADRITEVRRMVEANGGQMALFALPLVERWVAPNWPSPALFFDDWIGREQRESEGSRVVFFDPIDAFLAQQGELTGYIQERGFAPHERGTKAIDETYPGYADCLYLSYDFGHLSVRGHEVLAGVVFEQLQAGGLLPTSD